MALAELAEVSYAYPGATAETLARVSLRVEAGEKVLVLGPSGGGKSTLLRALAGLVPHFHGGRFAGRVTVAGRDTRSTRPAELAGTVASVFQDPENQVVMTRVAAEVEFGLENVGTPVTEIAARARAGLAAVGAVGLAGRRTAELSAGELQRVCLASALALAPELLLLDEPTSQLDPAAAATFLELALEAECAVVVAEQRPVPALERCDRVLFVEGGQIVLDAPREPARQWLDAERPEWLAPPAAPAVEERSGGAVVAVCGAAYAYGERQALAGADLTVRAGEVVALTGPNGVGKTTLARIAAGLLEPAGGSVERRGRAAYLAQDPGRYVVCERALDEVALGAGGDHARAWAALAAVGLAGVEERHPRDLSSGERERLALAAVLVTDPDLLVLDEPTRGVDPARKAELARLLRAGQGRRGTLVVTHDRHFAAAVADREVALGRDRELAHA